MVLDFSRGRTGSRSDRPVRRIHKVSDRRTGLAMHAKMFSSSVFGAVSFSRSPTRLCNLLLLPGGILSMGGGFFFGHLVGIFPNFGGKSLRSGVCIRDRQKSWSAANRQTTFQQPQTANPGWSHRTARLEDRGIVTTQPLGALQPSKLSLRPDPRASQSLFTLGGARSESWTVSVRVHRYSWSIRRRYGPRDAKTGSCMTICSGVRASLSRS